jgi:ornithine cyclodeaminase/alanine dehydrogenase-like protein (mu-crystallin family)
MPAASRAAPKMTNRSHTPSPEDVLARVPGAYRLSYEQTAARIDEIGTADFIQRLATGIEATYLERTLRTIARVGYNQPTERFIDTLEVMSCEAHDYTCGKWISSNPSFATHDVPVVTGTLQCFDRDPASVNQVRLMCDTGYITPLRTAVSTGVVMRKLGVDAESIGIIGSGLEGCAHAFVLSLLLPSVRRVVFHDVEPGRAQRAAEDLLSDLADEGIRGDAAPEVVVAPVGDSADAARCDAIVTATYGDSIVLSRADVHDGAFIAAVGADLRRKRELSDELYADARFVADDLRQCLIEGELQYAADVIDASVADAATIEDHRGTLLNDRIVSVGDLLTATRAFVDRPEPIIIYDSTGFSGQDLAVARILLEELEAAEDPTPWNPFRRMTFSELKNAGRRQARRHRNN